MKRQYVVHLSAICIMIIRPKGGVVGYMLGLHTLHICMANVHCIVDVASLAKVHI